MTIEVVSFDGFALNGATYQGRLLTDGAPFARTAAPTLISTIGGYPRDEGFQHQSVQLQLVINVRTTLTTGMDVLKAAFRAGRSGQFVISVDGVERRRLCRVESSFPFAPSKSQFLVNLVAADPRWRAVSETEDIEPVTATGQTWNVTNDGNAVVDDAVFVIQPTSQKAASAGWQKRRQVILANRVKSPLGDFPIDVASGVLARAARFTPANTEYLSIADNAALSTGDIAFSVFGWFRLVKGASRVLAAKWTTSGNQREYLLEYDSGSDRFRFNVSNDGSATVTVTANNHGSPVDGAWVFIIAWHDPTGNTIQISVNNGSANSQAHSTGVLNSTARFALGALGDNSNPYSGDMAGVGFVKAVLTATQRTKLYEAGLSPDLLTSMQAYWRLDEASGTRVDRYGSNDLADNNTVTVGPGPQTPGKHGINHAAMVTAGASLSSAADVRVLLDGSEWPRYPGEHADTDPNSIESKFWATPDLSAGQDAHLFAAITATSPADGEELVVRSGEVKSWPPKGHLVNVATGEVISYDGWTIQNADGHAAFQGIKRAQRGTLAAVGSAGDTLWMVERRVDLISGYTGASAPETHSDLKPLLNLASQTLGNDQHEWIDFYDDLYPTRPGQWTRRYEPREDQAGYFIMARAPSVAAPNLTWKYYYQAQQVGYDIVNVVRRLFPTGLRAASDGISLTRSVERTMRLDLLTTTAEGEERQLTTPQTGPLSSSSLNVQPTTAKSIALFARSQVPQSVPEVPGYPLSSNSRSDTTAINAVNASGSKTQIVRNDSDETIVCYGVDVIVSQPNTPKVDMTIRIYADNGSGAPGSTILASGTVLAASISAFGAWVGLRFAVPLPLLAGEAFHVECSVAGGTHSNTLWWDQPGRYENAYPIHGYRIIGETANGGAAAPARAEAAGTVVVDGITAKLDLAGVPYVAVGVEEACYWLNGKLTNNTTGQSLTFGLFVATNDEIEVDVGRRTVRNLTTGDEGLIYGIEASDADQWISIAPGTNELQWDEAGVVAVSVTTTSRSAWE